MRKILENKKLNESGDYTFKAMHEKGWGVANGISQWQSFLMNLIREIEILESAVEGSNESLPSRVRNYYESLVDSAREIKNYLGRQA